MRYDLKFGNRTLREEQLQDYICGLVGLEQHLRLRDLVGGLQ